GGILIAPAAAALFANEELNEVSMVPSPRATVLQLAAALDGGKTTSRALVDEALARIADPAGEGKRSFTKIYAEEARRAADAQDALRRAGYKASALAGLPVSI